MKNKIPVTLVIEMSDDAMRDWSRVYGCPLADVAKDVQGYVYVSVRQLDGLSAIGAIVRRPDDL